MSQTERSSGENCSSFLDEDIFVFSNQAFQTMKPVMFLEITRCCWKPLTNLIIYYYYYYYYGCDNDDDNLYMLYQLLQLQTRMKFLKSIMAIFMYRIVILFCTLSIL